MTDTTIVCATPTKGKPVPKGKPEPKRKGQLPVPPPKHPELSATDIPEALRRPPPTKEELAALAAKHKNADRRRNPVMPEGKAAAEPVAKNADPVVLAEVRERKAAKARGRIERRKAQQSGATKAMPLEGKAALAAIAKAAVENGHPVKRIPAGESSAKREAEIDKLARKGTGKPKGKANPAKAGKVPDGKPKPAAGPRNGTKTALIADLLRRPEGCTTADVLKATGWPSVSMPQQAKAVGVKLRKEKDGKVTRYRAA